MNKEMIDLVPQLIIDLATNYATSNNSNVKHNYMLRLEAIRDYCNLALNQNQNNNFFKKKAAKR